MTNYNGAGQPLIGGVICAFGLGLHGAATMTTGWTAKLDMGRDDISVEIGIFKVCISQVCIDYKDPSFQVRLVQAACVLAIIVAAVGLICGFMHATRRWNRKPEAPWMQRVGFSCPCLAACLITAATCTWALSVHPDLYNDFDLHYSFYMCCAGGGILIIGAAVIFKSPPPDPTPPLQIPLADGLTNLSPVLDQTYPVNPPPYNQEYPPMHPPPVRNQIYSVGYDNMGVKK